MAEKLTQLQLTEILLNPRSGRLNEARCLYIPKTEGSYVERLRGDLTLQTGDLGASLRDRLTRLLEALRQFVGVKEYEIEKATVAVASEITWARFYPESEVFDVFFETGNERGRFKDLTESQNRLLASILSSLTALSWKDLHRRLGLAKADSGVKPRVFISYRQGHEKFAESLANRLGQEGMVPWFDKWEVVAGDSLPGKIEEAFRESIAFVPVITDDYQTGVWATEELRTAIVKRVETEYRIVPVLLDQCKRPELIAQLVYVDMTDRDPQTFEAKIAELLDGIFALASNPFRE